MILKKILSLFKTSTARESESIPRPNRTNAHVTLALLKKEKSKISKNNTQK